MKMSGYCENETDCRRSQLLAHFGEHFDPHSDGHNRCNQVSGCICDNCARQNRQGWSQESVDFSVDAQAIVSGVIEFCYQSRNITLVQLVTILRGASEKSLAVCCLFYVYFLEIFVFVSAS